MSYSGLYFILPGFRAARLVGQVGNLRTDWQSVLPGDRIRLDPFSSTAGRFLGAEKIETNPMLFVVPVSRPILESAYLDSDGLKPVLSKLTFRVGGWSPPTQSSMLFSFVRN